MSGEDVQMEVFKLVPYVLRKCKNIVDYTHFLFSRYMVIDVHGSRLHVVATTIMEINYLDNSEKRRCI